MPDQPDPLDRRPETAEVDEALLDVKGEITAFLVRTAGGGQAYELQELLDGLNTALVDAYQAAEEVDTYQGWLATDISPAPDH